MMGNYIIAPLGLGLYIYFFQSLFVDKEGIKWTLRKVEGGANGYRLLPLIINRKAHCRNYVTDFKRVFKY